MSQAMRTPTTQKTRSPKRSMFRRQVHIIYLFPLPCANYIQICHETLRITVIQRLEHYLQIQGDGDEVITHVVHPAREDMDNDEYDDRPFEPFKDLCKRRFLWYYDSYIHAISKEKHEVREGQVFARMPFEGPCNEMVGKFYYTELENRLNRVKKALDAETSHWAKQGMESVRTDTSVASNLRQQYGQCVEYFKRSKTINIELSLVENNPFVWMITYFGKPMTDLDGGFFRVKLCMSPNFPEEQPRARFETALFHHRIANDGTPCYTAVRADDIRSHIEGIVSALEEEHPPYDPRTLVNPEASKLYWGSADDKKKYRRQLRRSVQRSME